MTTPNHCGTCKYWRSPGNNFGTCEQLKIATKMDHVGVYVLLPAEMKEEPSKAIVTLYFFGCVYHETKE